MDRICRGDLQNYNFHQVSMPLSHAEEIILCILYAIIFIANIVGNLFVCAIVLKTKKLQNFTNILIVNMAVGDVIVGVIGVMHIILEVLVLISSGNEFTLLCGVLNGIVLFSASISIYTMAVLAYDRYLSVVKPMERRTRLTKGKLKYIFAVIWVFSFAILVPSLFFIHNYEFKTDQTEQLICWNTLPQREFPLAYRITLFTLMYVIPMFITLYFFGKIFIHLWMRKQSEKSPSTNQVLLQSRQRVTKILGSVILLFNICWLPWFVFCSFGVLEHSQVLESSLALLAVTHSTVNPFVYSFQSSNFRRHIRRITKRKHQVDKEKELRNLAAKNSAAVKHTGLNMAFDTHL